MKIIKNLAIIILMIITIIILSTKVEAMTGEINAETVRVRKEPSTSSTILTQLDKGEEIEVLEQTEGWYKVEITLNSEKITGYISEKLVDLHEDEENTNNNPTNNETEPNNNEETPIEKPTTETNLNIEINKSYTISQEAKIKILPLMNSREKATINSGNIKITEIINDWCKIENDTEYGWIRINILKKSININTQTPEEQPTQEKPEENEQTPVKKPETTNTTVIKTGYVSTESLKVRKEASTSSEMIDSLTKNSTVSIIEELDGWYRIKIGDKIGYVSSKYVSDRKVEETTSRGTNSTRADEISEIHKQDDTVEEIVSTVNGEAVVEYAKKYLGYRYVSGGASPSTGFDCSGFTSYVYKHFGITLNRTSREQIKNGVKVERSNLQPGDLILFNGESNKTIGHVGIYTSGGNFIHASNPTGGVKITTLSSSYYNTRYVEARRVIN